TAVDPRLDPRGRGERQGKVGGPNIRLLRVAFPESHVPGASDGAGVTSFYGRIGIDPDAPTARRRAGAVECKGSDPRRRRSSLKGVGAERVAEHDRALVFIERDEVADAHPDPAPFGKT